jgi:hypothetical protein
MTLDARVLLVRILSSLESVWRPIRQHYLHAGVICAARRLHRAADGGDVRARKAAERQRDELRKAGALVGDVLSPPGRRLARRWVWPFYQRDMIEALSRIKSLATAGHCRLGDYVPETLIAGSHHIPTLSKLQAVILPLLADGILQSTCTTSGQAFYRLSDIVSPDDAPELVAAISIDADSDELDPALCDVYSAEFRQTWDRVLRDTARYQDIGELPTPECVELVSRRHPCDYRGIKPLFSLAKAQKEK